MLKWLKKKANQAVVNQCKLNIKISTKTLITVSSLANKSLVATGGDVNDKNIRKVSKAQEELLKDIILGCSNGLSIEDIQAMLIYPIWEEFGSCEGALRALNHVINTALETTRNV